MTPCLPKILFCAVIVFFGETLALAADVKRDDSETAGYAVRSSTKIDFNEAAIDGRLKAPDGFFLQGRKAQDMQNLLKLRSDFRKELSGSAAAAEVPQQ